MGALPWVAPVYRAMPQVDEVIEFPFQHGGLQFKARRTHRQAGRGPLRRGLCAAQFAQERAAAVPRQHPQARRLSGRSARRPAHTPAEESQGQAADGGLLLGAQRRQGRPGNDRPQLHLRAGKSMPHWPRCAPASAAATTSSRRAPNTARPSAGPPIHYAELARSLDRPAVLLGSGKEAALCEEIAGAPAAAPASISPARPRCWTPSR